MGMSEPHYYLGMFTSKRAAIVFGIGAALYVTGTILRIVDALL